MSLSTALGHADESENRTRKARIDPRLRALGWAIVRFDQTRPLSSYTRHTVEEYPTGDGPADYVLFVDGRILGIVEPKKGCLDPQNVLSQVERWPPMTLG